MAGTGSHGDVRGAVGADHAGVRAPFRVWLLLFLAEKTVQHAFVTVALAVNLHAIRSTVAISPGVLIVAGAALTAVAALAWLGVRRGDPRSRGLAALLAVADILGEFVAQGTLAITLNVSFIVAIAILVLLGAERRGRRGAARSR